MKFIKQIKSVNDFKGTLEVGSIIMNGSTEVIELGNGGGSGIVTEFTGTKSFNRAGLTELNNWAVIGALLFANGDDNDNFVVEAGDTWDPKCTDTNSPKDNGYKPGYTLIGVCVGKGLWASIQHNSTEDLKWANNEDVLYNTCHGVNIHGNGWESTQHIFTHKDRKDNDLIGTIWGSLITRNGIDEYIPSKYELLEIFDNCCDDNHDADKSGGDTTHTYNKNLGLLLSLSADDYWSSTQYSNGYGNYNIAFSVNFYDGYAGDSSKLYSCRSLALLHF